MKSKTKVILRKKFASQVDEQLLNKMYCIANEEGRLFRAVLEEAMKLYINSKKDKKIKKGYSYAETRN